MTKMLKRFGLAAFASAALAALTGGVAYSQTCSWTVLANGTTADANAVMGDLYCAALLNGANFTGNVGVGTTGPAFPLDVNGIIHSNSPIYTTGVNGGFQLADRISSNTGYSFLYRVNNITNLWDSAAGNVLSYTGNGYVGIGTISPDVSLTVQGGADFGVEHIISASGASEASIGFRTSSDAVSSAWVIGKDVAETAGNFDIYNAGYRLTITPGGNVGIATATPGTTYQLYVAGSAYATGTWTTSDGRLKQHVATVTNGLALVEQLRPVRYDWLPVDKRVVGKDLRLATDRHQIGFMAQEVEKVVPEAVTEPAKGGDAYSMNEAALIPVLTKAIQEQQDEIKRAQAEIADLRASVADLKSKVGATPAH